MNNRGLRTALALFAATTLLPTALASTDTVGKIREARTIVVGYRDDAFPFSHVDAQGKPAGYAVELCVQAVERMKRTLATPNLAITWKPVTFANRFSMLTDGAIDLECGCTSNTTERQRNVAFGPTFFVSRLVAGVRAESGFKSLTQAAGKPIAVTQGTSSAAALKRFEKARSVSYTPVAAPDPKQAFEALASGRSAGVLLDLVPLIDYIHATGKADAFRILDDGLGKEGYAAVYRKNDPGFRDLVDAAFAEVMTSGEAERLYEKWFTRPIPPRSINFNLPIAPELKALFQRPSSAAL